MQLDTLDDDCVEEFARYKQISKEEMSEKILKVLILMVYFELYNLFNQLQWNYDDITATYLLLLQQKLRGKDPLIVSTQ